jgi:hypothetical protein
MKQIRPEGVKGQKDDWTSNEYFGKYTEHRTSLSILNKKQKPLKGARHN